MSHVSNDWKRTVHRCSSHSVLSHNRGDMRLWVIPLLALLAQTFAADGEYNIKY